MKESIIDVKSYITKSKLPGSDYVINPYIGCPHACKYCYASFMRRFTGHKENWGEFLDIKKCDEKINKSNLSGENIFMSSVTDCYNEFEEKYRVTENILHQLSDIDCNLQISTKSSLALRDLEILKTFKHLKVALSINTLDEQFKNDMDKADSIECRLRTLKALHENGIYTVLFMSPIFPEITECEKIINTSKEYVDEYWLENLNLRNPYKRTILKYIANRYPQHSQLYTDIYINGDNSYWDMLATKLDDYCTWNSIKHINYFHHGSPSKQAFTSKS